MLNISDLKIGTFFIYQNQPYQVLKVNHSKQARAGAVLNTKIKNLKNGVVLERNFKASDKFAEAELEKVKASFLYKKANDFEFMQDETFEQVSLSKDILGSKTNWLKEGEKVELLKFQDQVINVELPAKVELKVVSAPPGVKGDTVSGATKQITLETGAVISAPLFIDEGNIVKVNTEKGEYVERV